MKVFLILALIFSFNLVAKVQLLPSTDMDKQLEEYYPLVEKSLVQREKCPSFFHSLEYELQTQGYLGAMSVQNIKKQTKIQNQLRHKLLAKALEYEPWIKNKSIKPQLRLKGVMLSLSAALVMYDNYLLNISMFQRQKHLREIINSPDSEYQIESRELLFATKEYSSIFNYFRMKKAIKFYSNSRRNGIEFDEQMVYLQNLIESSPSYRALLDKNFFQIVAQKLSFYGRAGTDEVSLVKDNSVNLMSEVFGNGVGLVATRKGKMYDKQNIELDIRNTLIAGDILLEKTPFRLTDKFIPGYWGHAAVWIGTKQELIALGIWDNPIIKPHHKEIEDGHQVIEAIRSGVSLSALHHFLNIDDMAILRESKNDYDKKSEIVLRAFAQLGKAYDFNFDVETTDKIVCSELVYTCYPHIKWPTSKAVGRYTVSPDNIAQKTTNNELKLISLYHTGKEVHKPTKLWNKMLKDEL